MELIDDILREAEKRYENKAAKCIRCSYQGCNNDCGNCLDLCHFPDHAKAQKVPLREYNCTNMADFYVCKYSYKYASEIIYALQEMEKQIQSQTVNFISLGCGPCTDLFALDSIEQRSLIPIKNYSYIGIDKDLSVWSNIHSNIKSIKPDVRLIEYDVTTIIDYSQYFDEQKLNIVCIDYLLSTMKRNSQNSSIDKFIDNLSNYLNKFTGECILILNDINLGMERSGEREYFDVFYNKLINYKCLRRHFINNRKNYYRYGSENNANSLLYDIFINENAFTPYKSCGSAQMIIYRQEMNI